MCFELVSGWFRVRLGAGRAKVWVQGVKWLGSGDRSSRASPGGGTGKPEPGTMCIYKCYTWWV